MWIITGVLLGAMLLATEVGFRAASCTCCDEITTQRLSIAADVQSVLPRLRFHPTARSGHAGATRAELHSLRSRATNI